MFYKLLIALLVIGGLAPFTFIKGKDGQPLMSFSDITMPDTIVPDISLPDLSGSPSEEGTVYKWKDKGGTWQFTSEPPPKGMDFSSTVYDQNMNVIQAVETKRTVVKKKELKENVSSPSNISDLGNSYSPEKIKSLFEDANNLETLLDDRFKKQSEVLDNL